jgi:hypothetical protein
MSLVARLKAGWHEAFVQGTFRSFEAQERQRHLAEAENRFDASSLRSELQRFLQPHHDRCGEVFDVPLAEAMREFEKANAERVRAEERLVLLGRNFNEELMTEMVSKSRLERERKELFAQQAKAAGRLHDARGQIDRWHNRSKRGGPFGNAGKVLPSHSPFGQSFGDLNSVKAERDEAADKNQASKRLLDENRERLDACRDEIERIRLERGQQEDLYRSGHSVQSVRDEIEQLIGRCKGLAASQSTLRQRRGAFLARANELAPAQSLKQAIAVRESQGKAFVESFDTEPARAARLMRHRAAYFTNRATPDAQAG